MLSNFMDHSTTLNTTGSKVIYGMWQRSCCVRKGVPLDPIHSK